MVCACVHNLCLFKIAHLKTVYNIVHSWLPTFSWEQIVYKWQTEAGAFPSVGSSTADLETKRETLQRHEAAGRQELILFMEMEILDAFFKFALMPILRERLSLQIALPRSKTEPP